MNAPDNFRRLNTLIQAGLPIPAELGGWWASCVGKFERGECKTLCLALGIRGAGIRHPKNRELMIRRDALLSVAVSSCSTYPGESLWSKCETLADLIRRWPRSRDENPLLPRIFDIGVKPPNSAGGIYDRVTKLAKTGDFSQSKRWGKLGPSFDRWPSTMNSKKRILKNALSYLQKHEGLSYQSALQTLSNIIATGAAGDNPLFAHLIEAELPSDPDQLHQLLIPGADHG